jgi:hypothetical protein
VADLEEIRGHTLEAMGALYEARLALAQGNETAARTQIDKAAVILAETRKLFTPQNLSQKK